MDDWNPINCLTCDRIHPLLNMPHPSGACIYADQAPTRVAV
jgi:hypothetical protein